MKKIVFALSLLIAFFAFSGTNPVSADDKTEDTVIKIEIPSNDVEKVDVKYEKDKSLTVKETLSNDSDSNKSFADNASEKTKQIADKTKQTTSAAADKTKGAAKKTADVTKKSADAAKRTAKKTMYETKDIIDAVNPNKVYTQQELKTSATVKTLKNERNEIKNAYNSRIKDVKAKIKAAENSTEMSEVQKRNRIHMLEVEKKKLENEKASYMNKYEAKIEAAREAKN